MAPVSIPKVAPNDYNTIMLWLMYATMEEEDLKAAFAYLKSLESIDQEVERWVSN